MLCTALGSFILGTLYWISILSITVLQIREIFVEDITVPLDDKRLNAINNDLIYAHILGGWEFFLQACQISIPVLLFNFVDEEFLACHK